MNPGVQRLGKYELQKHLGSGKTGEVWLGYDAQAQRPVILKVFSPSLPLDSQEVTQFRQEAWHVASLRHPGIARIYDLSLSPSNDPTSSTGSRIYLVTEYVEGQSLAQYLQRMAGTGKMRPGSELVRFFAAIAQEVDYAHQHSLIHGNLKPSNLFLRESSGFEHLGEPVLTDFGFVKLLQNTKATADPLYLSPEQIRGQAATERSDIYSLGVILYELCTGVLPFRGNRPIAIMVQHLNTPPTLPALLNPTISSSLSEVILQSLEKEPEKRFPSATHLAVALARALQIPFPDALIEDEHMAEIVRDLDASSAHHPRSLEASLPFSEPRQATHREEEDRRPLREGTGFPLAASWKRPGTTRMNSWLTIVFAVLLVAMLATLVTLFLLPPPPKIVASEPLVGHAFFLNSGQISTNSPGGINDELQVDLSNIPAAPAGKSYYAWLLADASVSESLPLSLGPLSLNHGKVHLLYHGDAQHTNLLGVTSRFLITLDNAQNPSSNPLLDTSTWRYFAEIPAEPIPGDQLHFSMLAHLRHLLVESPELQIRGLHGGLAYWFVRNTLTVMELANSARDAWNKSNPASVHEQVVRLLDYVDGSSFVQTDVPAGTPLLADKQTSQIALLGPVPDNPDPPGYNYNNEVPPGYIYLISEHMSGAVQSPLTTSDQKKLAIQVNQGLDEIKRIMQQMEQDARQLVRMSQSQLMQSSTLSLLNDLVTQAQDAYTGQLDPATDQSTSGALWIYENIQRLATLAIRAYRAPGQ